MNYIFYIIIVFILVLFILAGLAVVNYSNEELEAKYNNVSKIIIGITPIEFAQFISKKYFNNRIKLIFNEKRFCDSFASDFTLTISSEYANNQNLAGLAICAHELGHAFQFENKMDKMKKWSKKIKITKLLSKFTFPLIILSIGLLFFNKIICAGIFFAFAIFIFIIAIGVKYSSLKLEKEASEIGIHLLQKHTNLSYEQLKTAKSFLNSAKQTYVADLLKYMLRWTGLTKK